MNKRLLKKMISLSITLILITQNYFNISSVNAQEKDVEEMEQEQVIESFHYDEETNSLLLKAYTDISRIIVVSDENEIQINGYKKNEDLYVFEIDSIPNGTYYLKSIVYITQEIEREQNIENQQFSFTVQKEMECHNESKQEDKMTGVSLSIQGHIGVNCYFYLSESTLNNPNTYVQFIMSNGTIKTVSIDDSKESYGYTMFTFYIPIKELVQPFEVRLYSNGKEQTSYKYNMNQYCDYILKNEKDSKIVNITKSIFTYAYYAQQYFEYKLDNLPSYKNNLSNLDLKSYNYDLKDQNSEVDFVGARLKLNSKPCLKIYFSGTGVFTVDGSVVTTKKEGQYSVIVLEDIDDMKHMFLIETDNFSLYYGIYSYANSASKKQSNETLDLLKAMISYNETLIHEYANKPVHLKVLLVLDDILTNKIENIDPIEISIVTNSRENKGTLCKENGWKQEFVINAYERFVFNLDLTKNILIKDTAYEWNAESNTAIFYLYGKK